MLHQPAFTFGATEKMVARALYDAGKNDTEIGLELGVPVNNITHWRKGEGLAENLAPAKVGETVRRLDAEPRRRPPAKERPEDWGMERPVRQARPAVAPGLVTAQEAQVAFCAAVQPTGDNAIEIGLNMDTPVFLDLEELLVTRLLVQGNSGSGKSHLLRRVIEETTGVVQQIIIDPEGDFATLDETFGHTIIDAATFNKLTLAAIAARVREHRASVVLDLSQFKPSDDEDDETDISEKQMDACAAFLGGLFNAPKAQWHPALVFVDEAQLFAPASNASIDVDKAVRRRSVSAMADLMCRGRKRGLAGILATQRLAKLSTNVVGEVSNYLIGRTFFDKDIERAAELLGLKGGQTQEVQDLTKGQFLGVGPAIARRRLKVKVGGTMTKSPNEGIGLTPLPAYRAEELAGLLLPPEPAPTEPAADPAPVTPLRIGK